MLLGKVVLPGQGGNGQQDIKEQSGGTFLFLFKSSGNSFIAELCPPPPCPVTPAVPAACPSHPLPRGFSSVHL